MPGGTFNKIIQLGLLILTMTHAATSSAAPPVYTCPDSAQKFWKEFRQAALQSDLPALSRMTHFPLKVRGDLDDSPTKQISQSEFNKIFPVLQKTNPGMGEGSTSMKTYINKNETLPPTSCNKYGNQFRVGSWVFVVENNTWLLTQAFTEE